MSLTSFVNRPEIRKVLLELCPLSKELKPTIRPILQAPPLTKNYSQVGVAFDYLFRIFLLKINDSCAEDCGWFAKHALILLSDDPKRYEQAKEIVAEAESQKQEYLKSETITEELLCSMLKLATLEPIFRAGRGHEHIGRAECSDLYDLRHLIELIDENDWAAHKHCLLNPVFRSGILVGGADADILLDHTLIDIKTTKKIAFRREDINQLIGYYILHRFDELSNEDLSHEVKYLAIYYSRYEFLWKINVGDLISEDMTIKIMRWWRKIFSKQWESAKFPELKFD